ALKQAVRRNYDRFPGDFLFELSTDEMQNMVSQNVIPSLKYFGGATVYAFTEQGVAMLSSVLRSKKAIQINICIMRAFVLMRQWALNHQELSARLDALEQQHGQKFSDIEQVLNFLIQKDQKHVQQQQRDRIGFKK
ncbi:MAG: ORF6N domain-containing protein, partial [Flavobacteriia bacterium]|nr:ORF6N domain-containing protein [Flavobacteriia bacterium]